MTLFDFIIKAKISGYATGGGKQARKFEAGCLGFEFSMNGYSSKPARKN